MPVYLELDPVEFNGIYSQASMHRIEAWTMVPFGNDSLLETQFLIKTYSSVSYSTTLAQ